MWAIKSKDILIPLVSLATLVMIATGLVHIVLADPQHCDQSGWPTCYSVGYNVGRADGSQAFVQDLPFDDSCPSSHTVNFCSGYIRGYDAAYNANGKGQTISGGTCSTCSSSTGTSGHTTPYKQGVKDGRTDAMNSGIYDVGSSCGGYTSKECSHYIQGYHDGYEAACASSKFLDACSGDAPGTLKQ